MSDKKPATTIKLKTAPFLEALRIVSHVESNSAIAASQFVSLTLTGTQVQCRLAGEAIAFATATIPFVSGGSHALFLERKALLTFVENADEEMEFLIADSGTLLRSKGHRLSLPHKDVSGYGSWKISKAQPLTIPDDWYEDIHWLAKYVSPGVPLEHMTTVRAVKGYGLLGTDSVTLAVRKDSNVKQDFTIPALIAKLAKKGSKLYADDRGVGIVFGSNYVYQTYIATNQAFPLTTLQGIVDAAKKAKLICLIQGSEMLNAIHYLKKFGNLENVVVGGDPASKKLTGSQLAVSSASPGVKSIAHVGVNALNEKFNANWKASRLQTYLEHVKDMSNVEIRKFDHYGFIAGTVSAQYILILTEVTNP